MSVLSDRCAVSAEEAVRRVRGERCPARAKQARRHLQKLSTTLRPAENHVRSPSLDPTANALPTTAERSPTENGGFSATGGIGALPKCGECRGFDAGRFAIVPPAEPRFPPRALLCCHELKAGRVFGTHGYPGGVIRAPVAHGARSLASSHTVRHQRGGRSRASLPLPPGPTFGAARQTLLRLP